MPRLPARFAVALMLAAVLMLAACADDDDEGRAGGATGTAGAGGVVLVYREVQCLGNPWEADWLASHAGQQFPSDDLTRTMVFESYWRAQGTDVTGVQRRRAPSGDVVCAGCNCPSGFEWVVRVPPGQAAAAMARGFRQPP